MAIEYLHLLVFGLCSFYFVYTDLKWYWVPFIPMLVMGIILLALGFFLPGEEWSVRILTSAYVLLAGGIVYLLLPERLGLGDIFYVSLMALAASPWVVYFSVLTAVILSLIYYFQAYLSYRKVFELRLPFIPILFLGFMAVEILRGNGI